MTVFSPKDADAWYKRNKHKLGVGEDPVIQALDACDIHPESVLEIGCVNGWRLERLRRRGARYIWGVELSGLAIADARKRLRQTRKSYSLGSTLSIKRAPAIIWAIHNTIIHGFNLYVTSQQHLTRWVYYTDMMLRDGGYIVIHDFLPEHPYSRVYEHNPELRSNKMDHAQLWLAHPAYSMVRRDIYGEGDDRTHVSILKKEMTNAFPLLS